MQSPRRTPRSPVALALTAALAACQSYEPAPLDLDAHRRRWEARGAETELLDAFAARLAERPTPPAELDLSDGVTLAEARWIALLFHPDLRLARAQCAAAGASAEYAGLLADPELQLDFERVLESISDPWKIALGVGVVLPLSGVREAEVRVADAGVREAQMAVLEAEWLVWYDLDRAWIAWSTAHLLREELEALLAEVRQLAEEAGSLVEQGVIAPADAARFRFQAAHHANALIGARGAEREAEQLLRAQLGLSPGATITLVPSLGARTPGADAASVDALAAQNPTLRRLREAYAVAEERLHLEIRAQYPDLDLGPRYEADQGDNKLGVSVDFPLPLWNANQLGIAEARAARELARAAFETEFERLVGQRAAAEALATALADQVQDLRTNLAPFVERQHADTVRLLSLGESSTLALMHAHQDLHDLKVTLLETTAAAELAAARLTHLVGPPLP